MTDSADNQKSPWQGWANLLIGTALLARYGIPAAAMIRLMLANQVSPRGMLIANCFIFLNIFLALMTIATGMGQVGRRNWAPGLNAVTAGAVLMNAGYRLYMYRQDFELKLFWPDMLLVLWWGFSLRRGPWTPALIAAAASFGANFGIYSWLGQTRF